MQGNQKKVITTVKYEIQSNVRNCINRCMVCNSTKITYQHGMCKDCLLNFFIPIRFFINAVDQKRMVTL